MFSVSPLETIPVQNVLGEGVTWRSEDQTLWWTDIEERKLFRLMWEGRELKSFDLPERLGSFGFVKDQPDCLICAFETGFAFYWPVSQDLKWIAKPKELVPGRRLNDGRIAPDGSFWAGSMLEAELGEGAEESTGYYRCDPDGDVRLIFPGLSISNGIAWVDEGNSVVFSDSKAGKVYRASASSRSDGYHKPGLFLDVSGGAPDGACTDINGNYWSAIWGGSEVRCYDRAGNTPFTLGVPALQPTCVCFGGPQSNLLFITSARSGLSKEQLSQYPQSGDLFVYETDTCGTASFLYTRTAD